jgi:hypothetical protein
MACQSRIWADKYESTLSEERLPNVLIPARGSQCMYGTVHLGLGKVKIGLKGRDSKRKYLSLFPLDKSSELFLEESQSEKRRLETRQTLVSSLNWRSIVVVLVVFKILCLAGC